jgi:hypothetical protein
MPGKHHTLGTLPLHLSPRRRLIAGAVVVPLLFALVGLWTSTSRQRPEQSQPITPPPASASAVPSPSSSSPAPSRSSSASPPAARRTSPPARVTTAACTDQQSAGYGSGGGFSGQREGCRGQQGGSGYSQFGRGRGGWGGF